MDLKIKDVSELLNVSETTIRRWLLEGKIPAYRINQQYRFSRQEVEDWVMNQKQKQAESAVFTGQPEKLSIQPPSPPLTGGKKQFSLYRAIHKGNVLYNIPGSTKEEVIRNTVKVIADNLNLDAEVLTELLLERENLQPTALNNGIGIPHTRDFLLSAHYDLVTVVFPQTPLVYGSLDGLPVHTLFFLFACDDKNHLHLLAKIAHLSGQAEMQQFLQSKPSKENFLEFIRDWEGAS